MATRKSLAQISKQAEQKVYFSSEYGFNKKTDFKIGSDVYVIPLDLENGLFTGRYHEVQARKVGNQTKGLVGIYIHNLEDSQGNQTEKGANPFFSIYTKNGERLSNFVTCFDSYYNTSKFVYSDIYDNIEKLIEDAIAKAGTY